MELIVWERDGKAKRVRVPDEGLTIGRKPPPFGANYCTSNSNVSRQHCKLSRLGEAWYLEDLGSANGTTLNGELADGPMPIRSGDVLAIGGKDGGLKAQLVASDVDTQTIDEDDFETKFTTWDPIDKVRATYDIVAEKYADELAEPMIARPLERGLFIAFTELTRELGPGTVGDVGCGPGHITRHLSGLGLAMVGYDISAAMIMQARERFPSGKFHVASMLELPVADATWLAAVSLYATLHCAPKERALQYRELARVVRSGGYMLHAFYVSAPDQPSGSTYRLEKWFGHKVELDTYFVGIEEAAAEMTTGGFEVVAALVREPMSKTELPTRRCYMLGKRR